MNSRFGGIDLKVWFAVALFALSAVLALIAVWKLLTKQAASPIVGHGAFTAAMALTFWGLWLLS